jgi:hypothetical protein
MSSPLTTRVKFNISPSPSVAAHVCTEAICPKNNFFIIVATFFTRLYLIVFRTISQGLFATIYDTCVHCMWVGACLQCDGGSQLHALRMARRRNGREEVLNTGRPLEHGGRVGNQWDWWDWVGWIVLEICPRGNDKSGYYISLCLW